MINVQFEMVRKVFVYDSCLDAAGTLLTLLLAARFRVTAKRMLAAAGFEVPIAPVATSSTSTQTASWNTVTTSTIESGGSISRAVLVEGGAVARKAPPRQVSNLPPLWPLITADILLANTLLLSALAHTFSALPWRSAHVWWTADQAGVASGAFRTSALQSSGIILSDV